MLARIQKLLVIGLGLAATGWMYWFASVGRPGVAVCGAVLVLLSYAIVLSAEFVLLGFAQRPDTVPRPGLVELLRAYLGECATTPQVFFWRQPFRSKAEPDHVPTQLKKTTVGVVLVHGFFSNRGFWNPWMRRLRARGIPFIAVSLEPVFGSIDQYSPQIEAAVATIEKLTAQPVVLVGHSMGGLALRAWLAQADSYARARRVITIATPHQGTWLARFGYTVNGKQMRLRAGWLSQLAARESLNRSSQFTCFFGRCDNIVFPAISATLPSAVNVHLPGVAHVQMAYQDVVFHEVMRWLKTPT